MSYRHPALEAFFLPSQLGQLFCLYHAPRSAAAAGAVLYLHPFAEEMNKSRRMAALQCGALAARGYGVLQIDLHGCGDSSGDFGDATWDRWINDAVLGWSWLDGHCRSPRRWIWGLRAGCLLAAAVARRMRARECPDRFLFWQPPSRGRTLLQQFMRLRVASSALRGNDNGGEASVAGEPDGTIEVAGYALHPALREGLGAAELDPPPTPGSNSLWFETSTRESASPSPAAQAASERWRQAGHQVHVEVVAGPGFWQTQEIEVAPALIEASIRGLLLVDAHSPA